MLLSDLNREHSGCHKIARISSTRVPNTKQDVCIIPFKGLETLLNGDLKVWKS